MHPLDLFKYCPKCGSNHFVENNFKSKRCEKCGFVYYFNPCAATVALIINEKGELLVATRANDPAKGTLDLPGGFVDMDETAEEAIKREIKEETGMDIYDLKYLYSIPNRYPYSGLEVHTLDMIYLCKVNDTSNLKPEDDVSKLEFIKIKDLDPEQFGLHSIKQIVKKIQNMTI